MLMQQLLSTSLTSKEILETELGISRILSTLLHNKMWNTKIEMKKHDFFFFLPDGCFNYTSRTGDFDMEFQELFFFFFKAYWS